MQNRSAATLIGLGLLLALVVVVRLSVGPYGWEWPRDAGVWELRLPRIWAGVVVGSSLAMAGVMLQSLLRNPLASPDLIGPGAGAGLAVMARAYLWQVVLPGGAAGSAAATLTAADAGAAANAPAAFLGAIAALGLVYALSQRRGFVDPVSMILIGVIVGILCGAATMFLAHLLPDRGFGVFRWSVGQLTDETPRATLILATAAAAAGLLAGVVMGPAMDAAALGDDEAHSSGVNLRTLRAALFILSGALTAAAVVVAGPVGFVGLVCPHLVRLMAGPSHRVLVIGAALAGASLIVGADAAVRLLRLGGGLMPIGVVTALVGGPAFIVLLRREMATARYP